MRRHSTVSAVTTRSECATPAATTPLQDTPQVAAARHCFVPQPMMFVEGDAGGLAALATVACEASI